jgi:hypothetical protein
MSHSSVHNPEDKSVPKREQTWQQDFAPLALTPRDLAEVEALRLLARRTHDTHSRRGIALRIAPELMIYIRRESDAGISATAIAKRLKSFGLVSGQGGVFKNQNVRYALKNSLWPLLDDRPHQAIRSAVAALERVLEDDSDVAAPVLRPTARRAVRAAIAAMETA